MTVIAILGLTACDGDHYVAIFGALEGTDQPGCVTFCVDGGTALQTDPLSFKVKLGESVRFFNLTDQTVTVTLVYARPDTTTINEKTLVIQKGKSKSITIKKDLPIGTSIEFRYKVGGPPDHGGPTMIVEP